MNTRNLTLALSLRSIGFAVAYEGGDKKPGWKLDANGAVEMRDGNPVYIDSAGKELILAADTVSRLNGEAKEHRERAERAETALRDFQPLIDAKIDGKKAMEAVGTVKDLAAGDLIKKGEVDRVRAEIQSTFTAQIEEKDKAIATLSSDLNSLHLDNAFKSSEWVKNNIAIPVDMLQAVFGKNFKRENGELAGYDEKGQRLLSTKNGGEYATFDEAIARLVDGYGSKDAILKGGGHSGTGNGGAGGANGGARVVKRADFDTMEPGKKAQLASEMREGKVSIVD